MTQLKNILSRASSLKIKNRKYLELILGVILLIPSVLSVIAFLLQPLGVNILKSYIISPNKENTYYFRIYIARISF
jgi:hypothetical protein